MKKGKNKRRISVKEIPFHTTVGFICGIGAVLLLLILATISTINKGNAGLLIGVFGMGAFGLSIYGLYMSVKGFREDDNMFYTIPVIGIGMNGLMTILYLFLMIKGIFS